MTVYDGSSRYLRLAVASILNQSFDDFEFVIIDDGSTDAAVRDTLREIERSDGRVRLFERPHAGIVPAANFGLAQCRGAFLARMDADDVALPHRFQSQINLLRSDPETAVVGGAYELVDEAGRLLRREYPPLDDAALQELCLQGKTPICQPLSMIRRSMMNSVGEYDASVETAEDIDLWLRLGEVGRLACVPDVILQYRQHAGSVSEAKNDVQSARVRLGVERAYARRGLDRTYEAPPAWRPVGAAARHDFLLRYGWWARNHAQRKTALVYGSRAIRSKPFAGEGWRLLLTSLLKPMPAPPESPHSPRKAA